MTELKGHLLQDIIDKKRKVNEVSDILQVSRQSVSKWLSQYRYDGINGIMPKKPGPKSGNIHNRTDKYLEDEVVRLGKENPFEGPVWIRDEIKELYSILIDQSTVYRILKRRKTRYYLGYYHTRKKRKLYVKDIPGRELQMDVSFPFGYQRSLCIYTAIDDATRYVISWIYEHHTENSTLDFINNVISKNKYFVRGVRTDQGREFSRKVTEYLKKQGIDHNKNPAYTPQHNGKVERYHRTMKENCCVYWKFKASIEELNYDLKLWTDYYNSKKKHYGLGMNGKTPEEKLKYFKNNNLLIMPLI